MGKEEGLVSGRAWGRGGMRLGEGYDREGKWV